MSNSNKKNAVIILAALLATFEETKATLDAITDTATLEEKETAQDVFNSAKDALDMIDETATAEEKQIAQLAFDSASEALNAIKDLPTPEDKANAQKAFDDAKLAYETASNTKSTTPKAKQGTLHGTFLLSPTGRFGLAYNVGESADLPELQAIELDGAGYFKLSK